MSTKPACAGNTILILARWAGISDIIHPDHWRQNEQGNWYAIGIGGGYELAATTKPGPLPAGRMATCRTSTSGKPPAGSGFCSRPGGSGNGVTIPSIPIRVFQPSPTPNTRSRGLTGDTTACAAAVSIADRGSNAQASGISSRPTNAT